MSTTSYHLCSRKDPGRLERILAAAIERARGVSAGCRLGNRSDLAARFRQAFAEWIVAASFAGPDLAHTIIDPHPRIDRGHDVIVRGYRISAFFSRHPGGPLVIPDPYAFRADFAALVQPPHGFERIEVCARDGLASEKFTVPAFAALIGGVPRVEVLRRCYRHDETGGLYWPRRRLWKIDWEAKALPFRQPLPRAVPMEAGR